MKKVIYFDLGVWKGQEIDEFISIATELNVGYEVIGFEADVNLFKDLYLKFKYNECVKIFNVAISDSIKLTKLYKSPTTEYQGNSIFETKNNVNTKEYDNVLAISLSSILTEHNLGDINILRFNIEGAELHLMQDLVNSGKHRNINIFCGSTPDIHKVDEIKHLRLDYDTLLINNNIKVMPFFHTENIEHRMHMRNELLEKIKILL